FWKLLVSTDAGESYRQVGGVFRSSAEEIKLDSVLIPFKGKIRIKILSESTSRINICDIAFVGSGTSGIKMNKTASPPKEIAQSSSNTLPSRIVFRGQDAQPEKGENSNLYFGNPSKASFADPDNYLINKYYYVQSYNMAKGTPNWVSWH